VPCAMREAERSRFFDPLSRFSAGLFPGFFGAAEFGVIDGLGIPGNHDAWL